MEVAAYPNKADRVIAKDCVGKAPGNTCYFDEFMKHISAPDTKDWKGTSVGQNLAPDVDSAARELQTGPKIANPYNPKSLDPDLTTYQNLPDNVKLLPTYVDGSGKGLNNFNAVYDAVIKRVNESRKIVPLDAETDALRRALNFVHLARAVDYWQPIVDKVKAALAVYKFVR